MVDFSWTSVDLGDDPRLVVGRRPRARRLEAERVDLHEDTFPVLREIAEAALAALETTTPRLYEPYAELEVGEEHFELGVASDETSDEPVADLTHIVRVVDDLPSVDARNLSDQNNLFYAICWPSGAGGTGFVTKTDPARVVRHGRFFQYRDALRAVDTPDLVLSDSTDFVVHEGVAGILRPTPFRMLFADVDVALRDVPNYVAATRLALAASVPLTDRGALALEATVSRRTSYAARLRRLSERLAHVPLTIDSVRAAAARHLDNPDLLVNSDGHLEFGEDEVAVVLDLLEGRLFEDDFSGEHRRADRYSTR